MWTKEYNAETQEFNESFKAYLGDLVNKADAYKWREKKLEFICDSIVIEITKTIL